MVEAQKDKPKLREPVRLGGGFWQLGRNRPRRFHGDGRWSNGCFVGWRGIMGSREEFGGLCGSLQLGGRRRHSGCNRPCRTGHGQHQWNHDGHSQDGRSSNKCVRSSCRSTW